MARVRGMDTTPELTVRRALHAVGLRYRLHRSDLPGTPDIVFPGRRIVVFVHGCFWHSHDCARARIPSTRREYWVPKLARTVERDRTHVEALTSAGWRVLTVWECALRTPDRLAALIAEIKAAFTPPKSSSNPQTGSAPAETHGPFSTSGAMVRCKGAAETATA